MRRNHLTVERFPGVRFNQLQRSLVQLRVIISYQLSYTTYIYYIRHHLIIINHHHLQYNHLENHHHHLQDQLLPIRPDAGYLSALALLARQVHDAPGHIITSSSS